MKPGVASSPDRAAAQGQAVLVWVITLISVAMGVSMLRSDLESAADISHLIAVSVRLSVPWLYLAFAASAIAALWPGRASRWLLRQRRALGLCYAAGMAWQLLFILWLVLLHREWYIEYQHSPYALAEEIPGYLLLGAMTLTSFDRPRRWLRPSHWRMLHTVGIWFLWGETWSYYWSQIYDLRDVQWTGTLYYWLGLLAWLLRIGAWMQELARVRRTVPRTEHGTATTHT
jgi:methionine sulfoxide reductase heme-binding subunit